MQLLDCVCAVSLSIAQCVLCEFAGTFSQGKIVPYIRLGCLHFLLSETMLDWETVASYQTITEMNYRKITI